MIKKIIGFLPLLFIGFFLIVKVILLFYNIYDVWVAAGRIAPFLEIPMYIEAALPSISLIGLFIRKKWGYILAMMFSLVMIEYFVFVKLFSKESFIDVFVSYALHIFSFIVILVLLNTRFVRNTYFGITTNELKKSSIFLSLALSALIFVIMNYGYLLFR